MNLKMKTLAAAVIATAAMSTANANSLLFPYFTTANGAQSVVSLTTTGIANAIPPTGPNAFGLGVHYTYNFGSACTHFDGWGGMSPNDLMQHSVAAPTQGGFGKVVGSDKSSPFSLPVANVEGFLVVTRADVPGTALDTAGLISGEMLIADPSQGIFTTISGITDGSAAGFGNYAALGSTLTQYRLSWFPETVATTRWFGVVLGDMSGAIVAGVDWRGAATVSNNNVVYDNDEVPFSGSRSARITCQGSIDAPSLMTLAQRNSVLNGGLMNVTVGDFSTATNAVATGMLMTKMQRATAAVGAPFAGRNFVHVELPR